MGGYNHRWGRTLCYRFEDASLQGSGRFATGWRTLRYRTLALQGAGLPQGGYFCRSAVLLWVCHWKGRGQDCLTARPEDRAPTQRADLLGARSPARFFVVGVQWPSPSHLPVAPEFTLSPARSFCGYAIGREGQGCLTARPEDRAPTAARRPRRSAVPRAIFSCSEASSNL